MPVLCLGEALVDLVCERPVAGLTAADAFVPHFGGATANVAVNAARHGASVALFGGAGDDAWGRWLLAGLEREGVGTEHFRLRPGGRTPLAFVTVDPSGEPTYEFYGDPFGAAAAEAAGELQAAVAGADALLFGSNTLVGEAEREATLAARARALELGRAVWFDPNLRLERWSSPVEAVAVARSCLAGCRVVKANRAEAELLTGEADAARGAEALAAAGAELAVVTLGAQGAVVRGAISVDVPAVPARPVSTVGAGDAFFGVLLARLEPDGAEAAAAAAAEAAARVTERWGAIA